MGNVNHEAERGVVVRPALKRQFLDLRRRQVGHRPVEDHVHVQGALDPTYQFGKEPGPSLRITQGFGKAVRVHDNRELAIGVKEPKVARDSLVKGDYLVRDLGQTDFIGRDIGAFAQNGLPAGVQDLPVVEEADA